MDAGAGDLEVGFFPAQHRMLLMFCAKGLQLRQTAALGVSLLTRLLASHHDPAVQAYSVPQR